jgi:hypothetical protein
MRKIRSVYFVFFKNKTEICVGVEPHTCVAAVTRLHSKEPPSPFALHCRGCSFVCCSPHSNLIACITRLFTTRYTTEHYQVSDISSLCPEAPPQTARP